VKVHPDGREKEWETLVNPEIPILNSKDHGITDEMVKDELPFERIGRMMYPAFKDCDICGFNVKFDLNFMMAEYQRIGLRWNYGKVIDSLQIYKKKERRNLTAAVKFYLNENHEGAHNALIDARASLRVLRAQLIRYDLPTSVPELFDLLNEAPEGYLDKDKKIVLIGGKPALNFGKKFNGILLEKVAKDYLQWIMRSEFSEEVKNVVKGYL
jgi:DNA polymerase-3 subunit epsilon